MLGINHLNMGQIAQEASDDAKTKRRIKTFYSGIGPKIILPYLVLTLIVAAVGAYIVVNLVTSTLQERFNNQLLDAGRVVSESVVAQEEARLATLRQIAFTDGVPQSVVNGDEAALAALVPQIMVNSQLDTAVLLDLNGNVIYGWHNQANATDNPFANMNLGQLEDVQLVLEGYIDELGDKRAMLAETPYGMMLFTVGPIFQGNEQVGAILVGADIHKTVLSLTENAVARVTLYDPQGNVLATTVGDGSDQSTAILQESPDLYGTVISLLQESPIQVQVVTENAETKVPLRDLEILNQEYELAFGDWRLRDQSFGLFSVALPRNFIVSTAATSRDWLNVVFIIATISVFTIGYITARHIVKPINKLVDTTTAVADGNLTQRTGIDTNDEIGVLASSFDVMTERLAAHNQQLIAQKSELSAILQSIADAVIVFDTEQKMVNSNAAAQLLLADLDTATKNERILQMLNEALESTLPKRFEIGNRVVSASSAKVQTPEGTQSGTVMVLRDITKEAEAENLKNAFITSVSHELRTPLTVVKVYADLMQKMATEDTDPRQLTALVKIEKASGELEQHIEKLINISELQAGTLSIKKEAIRLDELIQNLFVEWQPRMEKREIQFSLNLPEHPVWIDADPKNLHWALDNILNNAHNYTAEQGVVALSLYQLDGEAIVEIKDNGVGIASADQEYIFAGFFRSENNVNYVERGIGLGLFISRAILELHNGRIWVNSKLGEGSIFSCAVAQIEPPKQDTKNETASEVAVDAQ